MASGEDRAAANQRVYTAQVQDIVSDADMQPFRPDDFDANDTIEVHIVPNLPLHTRLLQTLLRKRPVEPTTGVSKIVLKFKRVEQGWECTDREYH